MNYKTSIHFVVKHDKGSRTKNIFLADMSAKGGGGQNPGPPDYAPGNIRWGRLLFSTRNYFSCNKLCTEN